MAVDDPQREARERIRRAKDDGSAELDLSRLGLKTLPPEIGGLAKLIRLYLDRNRLASLPPEIGRLINLQKLRLERNQLTSLPPEIGGLAGLQDLDLRDNQLTSLPPEIRGLASLHTLYLNRNQLTSLPAGIGGLAKLRILLLTRNQLTSLPAEIGGLIGLRSLDLENNQFTALPAEIGDLAGLNKLWLQDNRLTSLPDDIRKLTRLEQLYLHGNDALGLPPEVLGPTWQDIVGKNKKPARPADILDYYFRTRGEAKRRLNEAKVLVVGPEAVGKTSLVNFLVHDKHCDPHEPKTPGVEIKERINIESWALREPSERAADDEAVRLNVWDFGGQEILYGTHQFFLTHRSLYLLVLEARRENDDSIHYWLRTIRNRGGDSPIVVVINKAEPPHALRLDEPRLKKDYPSIRAFVRTSCLETGKDTVRELRDLIARVVHGEMPHVRDELPERDLAVKAELAAWAKEESVLDVNQYEELCAKHGITAARHQQQLLRLLNDLGTVIAHHDDEATETMHNVTLLDPNWITGAVYRLFTHTQVRDANGELDYDKIGGLLGDPALYPKGRWRFIVDMMECFGLCYEIPHTQHKRYLIPEQLPTHEPELHWPEDRCLRFRYDYDLLPAGVIPRFIVEAHENLTDKRTAWHNGAVLQADGCEVLIRGDRARGRVAIFVDGPQHRRRGALAVIRHHLDVVHRLNPQIAPTEKIPLPDNPELAADYRTLLTMEEAGHDEYWPDGADHAYSVHGLLDGIEDESERRRRRQMLESERAYLGERNGAKTARIKSEVGQAENDTASRRSGSPWGSGSFYLVSFVVVLATLAAASFWVPWYAVIAVFLAALLAITIIGALQLRNDDRFKEEGFLELVKEFYRRLPLLKLDRRSSSEVESQRLDDNPE